ncbi:MAG: FAD-binding oxidoreductase [Alphaproteobacteria bacterium]|nr:FAD-binding oxidoreductase [Alphaproteobacteria bacterium]
MNEMRKPITALSQQTLERLVAVVGDKNAIVDKDKQAPFLVEFRALWTGHSPVVLRPGSTKEVSEILKIANETSTAIVPQGGNTGLVGGQIPHNGEVVLSLQRLDKIREVDAVSNTITCEAGVTLQRAREAAEKVDRLYPQLLPSEGSCTIGGNLSTNAGGTAALAHGIARSHAFGLEVVLADGRIMNNLNKLKKDNTGYDLRDLFIGAEGTLGVITAAVLRLVPRPKSVETAWAAIPSVQAAVDLLGFATEMTAGGVTSFEIMSREGIDIVNKHSGTTRDPLSTSSPYVTLIELSSQRKEGLREAMEGILEAGLDKGLVLDATIAESVEQAKAFWRIRELFGEMQGREGGSIKHDVSVPVANIPAFIEEGNAAAVKLIPGARPLPFGHVGDGNIHYNISQPVGADKAEFLKRWDDMNDVIYKIVLKYGGSVSAEHGVGIVKRDYLPKIKDPVAYDLMKTLKRTLDPKGILNPGKVLP